MTKDSQDVPGAEVTTPKPPALKKNVAVGVGVGDFHRHVLSFGCVSLLRQRFPISDGTYFFLTMYCLYLTCHHGLYFLQATFLFLIGPIAAPVLIAMHLQQYRIMAAAVTFMVGRAFGST